MPDENESDRSPVLEVDGLTRAYGRKLALSSVSFSVNRGDVFGFLGPNGAGKTTTIRIALGLIRATSGRVLLFGEERRRAALPAMARIGAMVEVPSFYPHLSGRRNLLAIGLLSGVADADEITSALATVRLTEPADDPVRTYSQGMRQRLGIAQALLGGPELVILDEPTNGLDPRGVQEIRELIGRLNRDRGITFLISSHQLREVEETCNRVAILRKGRLLVSGGVDEIIGRRATHVVIRVDDAGIARDALPEVEAEVRGDSFLRIRADRDGVPEIVGRLVRAGVAVGEVRPERPTLEDYFLEVTEGEEADLGR